MERGSPTCKYSSVEKLMRLGEAGRGLLLFWGVRGMLIGGLDILGISEDGTVVLQPGDLTEIKGDISTRPVGRV